MDKPTIFFSHASKDSKAITYLKGRFVELTNGTLEVFASSDGQSIGLGSNWVSSVEAALKATSVMFVFVSRNSLRSAWLYFESGHAYSKGASVVPVGLGVDVGKLPPPLSLLQGFNVTNHDSLNNLLAKINQHFNLRFPLGFVEADFEALRGKAPVAKQSPFFGEHSDSIVILSFRREWSEPTVGQERLIAILEQSQSQVISSKDAESKQLFFVPGARLEVTSSTIDVEIDPLLAETMLPRIKEVFDLLGSPDHPYELTITFIGVAHEPRPYRIAGRLGSDVRLKDDNWLQVGNLDFKVGEYRQGMARVEVRFLEGSSPREVGPLLNRLFDGAVLDYDDE